MIARFVRYQQRNHPMTFVTLKWFGHKKPDERRKIQQPQRHHLRRHQHMQFSRRIKNQPRVRLESISLIQFRVIVKVARTVNSSALIKLNQTQR